VQLFMVFAFLILIVSYQAGLITLFYFPRLDTTILNITSIVTANAGGFYPVVMLVGSLPWRYWNAYINDNQTKLPIPIQPQLAGVLTTLMHMNKTVNVTVIQNFTQLLPTLQQNNNSTDTIVVGKHYVYEYVCMYRSTSKS
jgi:hypothetical protein